jgi:hypothetical protein
MRKVALALFAALALAGCGSDEETVTTATTASTPPPATTERPATTETPPPPPPPAPTQTVVQISYAGGKLAGGIKQVKVDKGMRVVLVVRSDVADEVHVHGIDIMRDVAPGTPARVSFVASAPGRYEVELEERGLQIADIQVQP